MKTALFLNFLAKSLRIKIFFSNFDPEFKLLQLLIRIVLTFISAILLLTSCDFKLRSNYFLDADETKVEILRFDRLQSRYLTTGDFSALQQMETDYPMETRALIENVLRIGEVNNPNINKRFLTYFQDSTLQVMINDVQAEFANMDDLNEQLNSSFTKLQREVPGLSVPRVYAQIGALDESIVVGNDMIGISLDKYMGENYPLYQKHYTLQQRKSMTRDFIVPDCLCFYLVSLYPLDNFEQRSQLDRDMYMGRMMWICNYLLGKDFFTMKYVKEFDKLQKTRKLSISQLLLGV